MLSTSATTTLVAEAFSMPEILASHIVVNGLPSNDGPWLDPRPSAIGSVLGVLGAVLNAPSQVANHALPSVGQIVSGTQAAASAGVHGQAGAAQANPQQGNPQQLVPQRVTATTQLSSLTGLTLLQQLALLPGSTIAEFVQSNPAAVQRLLGDAPKARDVQLLWADLGLDARSALVTSAPEVIGNLEGFPFALRDQANRRLLAATLERLEAAGEGGRSTVIDANNQLHMLQQVEAALESAPGAPPRHLLSLNPSAAGTAAIVIGDLESADYVSFLVPGMFYTVDGQMVEWTTAAQNVYDAEAAWLADLPEAQYGDASVATVAWIGYETPSLVNFTSLDRAYAGRDAIAAAITGLHTMRGESQPYLSLIAHSYGSTAAMMALTDYGIDIDAIAIIGSPGSSAQHASDLGVAGDNVFVGEAPWDQVKDSAFFGSDPGSSSFGAHDFKVTGGRDPVTGATLLGSVGHDEYFLAGSESLRNLALVALGQGVLVTTEAPAVSKGSTAFTR